MNFFQSLPPDKRSAADWELLISLYDKLNKLGELNPSDLPEDYCKKVIKLLEKKKDYSGLVNFVQSIPVNKRSAADWELLISSCDKVNMLGNLNPSDLPDNYCKKVIQLLEKKKLTDCYQHLRMQALRLTGNYCFPCTISLICWGP